LPRAGLCDARQSSRYFRDFYARRALRILPLYYGVLFVVLLVLPAIPAFRSEAIDAVHSHQAWLWLYGLNFLQAREGQLLPYMSHFWSLAVEEHFYLVWPLIVWLLPRHRLLAVCAGIAVVSATARVALAWWGVNDIALHLMTFTRLDGLCTGAFLAVYVREQVEPAARLRRVGVFLLIAGGTGALVTMAPSAMNQAPLPALLAARPSFIVLLLAALVAFGLTSDARAPLHGLLTTRGMRVLGKYSYGLYVFHALIADFMLRHGTLASIGRFVPGVAGPFIVQVGLGVTLSMALAVLSYQYYEKRFLVLKERFRSGPSSRALR